MQNRYISRYCKGETHFHRQDPWPYLEWQQEDDAPLWAKVLGAIGFIMCLLVLIFI